MPKVKTEYPIELNKCQKEIIEVLRYWRDSDKMFDGRWYGYNKLSEVLKEKYTIKELRKEVRHLLSYCIVTHQPTYSPDYELCGSGIFLDPLY